MSTLQEMLSEWENPLNPFQSEPDINCYTIIDNRCYRINQLIHLYGIVYAAKTNIGNCWITAVMDKEKILSSPKSFIAKSSCIPQVGTSLVIERWHYMFGIQKVRTTPISDVSRIWEDLYACTTSSGSCYYIFV